MCGETRADRRKGRTVRTRIMSDSGIGLSNTSGCDRVCHRQRLRELHCGLRDEDGRGELFLFRSTQKQNSSYQDANDSNCDSTDHRTGPETESQDNVNLPVFLGRDPSPVTHEWTDQAPFLSWGLETTPVESPTT
ncbi:hypothetical protein Bbelb_264660 [Branchiostoma belcheri]|nr:hypothetical protein Bbelb_264660 [Branchiostoma belcheri]